MAKKLGFGEWVDQQVSKGGNLDWSPKDYCGSIAAAWEIVERLHERGFIVSVHAEKQGYSCEINLFKPNPKKDIWIHLFGDTAPMAICKAFLKLEEER